MPTDAAILPRSSAGTIAPTAGGVKQRPGLRPARAARGHHAGAARRAVRRGGDMLERWPTLCGKASTGRPGRGMVRSTAGEGEATMPEIGAIVVGSAVAGGAVDLCTGGGRRADQQ